jgi:hypothetical protein
MASDYQLYEMLERTPTCFTFSPDTSDHWAKSSSASAGPPSREKEAILGFQCRPPISMDLSVCSVDLSGNAATHTHSRNRRLATLRPRRLLKTVAGGE